MFLLGYLILLLVASIPLATTALRHRGDPPSAALARRVYRDLAYIALAGLAIIVIEATLGIALERYWFAELGQSARFWLALGLQGAIFVVVLAFGGLFVAINWRLAARRLANLPPSAPVIAGFAVAALVAYGAAGMWTPLTGFLGATPSGITDPVFGRDLSFYMLRLPVYEGLARLMMTLLVITIAGWAAIGVISFMRLPAVRRPMPWGVRRPRLAVVDAAAADTIEQVMANALAAGRAAWNGWLPQGLLLAALFCLGCAILRFIARYHLVIDGHSGVVAGASWIDLHVWLPAYAVIITAWLAAAVVLAAAALRPGLRGWLFARRTRWLGVGGAFVVLYVGAQIVPAAVERLYVGPNQITLEQPYLLSSIAGTRRAYGLEGPDVQEQDFPVSPTPLTRQDLDNSAATLRDARIWDWRALEPQLQQTQGLRPYYAFSGVDIDRYQVDGAERQVIITARELDVAKLPPPAQVWVNLALKYTHGYGVVAAPVNEIDQRGDPVLWAHDIPIQAVGDLAVTHGEIYYGLQTNDRVYVHTTEKEFDYPHGDANAETVYGGRGGFALSNLWRRLVVARQFDGLRLFLSDYFTPQSRVLIRRNVVERVERLAPFLTFDRDPYIVADGDHYAYILDGYTSSANYPYSETYEGSVEAFHDRNYVRNAVKAVVDAYNGSVTFYVFAPDDPIIRAYRKMMPGLFKDGATMPANLRRHVRYPEDLFTVQAEMYGTYHMTNPTTFYNREDRWEVPHELDGGAEVETQPYYVMAQLPGASAPEFMLMLPLSVAGKNQMAGWLAGRSDGANYGKLVAFRFPKGRFVDGPAQVESRINSDSRFSADLTLWDQHGSRVIRGNLLILPLAGGQLVAIEPIYIEAEQTGIPTLARVVFGQLMPDDRRIEWADTLSAAEDTLVGGVSAPSPGGSAAPAAGAPTPDQLNQARAIFHDMQQAYASGDYVRYGQLMQQLGKILASP
ncbi:MAG TPA: UPF0182 family protein [Caulobacteraceae bacterium]|nr:UPF0182 family protein [Caulobacteraceae bacterium]